MVNNKIIKTAFLISLGAHSLLFVFPAINLPAPEIKPPKKIEITINQPHLLPKIDQLGEEKKLKEIKQELVAAEEKQTSGNEPVKVEESDTQAVLRYQDMIKQRIQAARRYPQWAKQQGYQGTTYLRFTVIKNGSARDIKILQSSGHKILDEEAVNTLKRAQPFPAIPEKIPFPRIKMEIAVVFQLS